MEQEFELNPPALPHETCTALHPQFDPFIDFRRWVIRRVSTENGPGVVNGLQHTGDHEGLIESKIRSVRLQLEICSSRYVARDMY